MAGSEAPTPARPAIRRRNIQGHTVLADAAMMLKLRRLSSDTINNLFRHAREQGMAPLRLDDEPYILVRHADHTFTFVPQDQRDHPVL